MFLCFLSLNESLKYNIIFYRKEDAHGQSNYQKNLFLLKRTLCKVSVIILHGNEVNLYNIVNQEKIFFNEDVTVTVSVCTEQLILYVGSWLHKFVVFLTFSYE
jgi:hypothetical protein